MISYAIIVAFSTPLTLTKEIKLTF